jgi:hypothetical protein
MQASKIEVDRVYAIKHNGELTRFCVTAVTTTRKSNTGSPHDYISTVAGIVHDGSGKGDHLVLDPKLVLGRFEEYETLVAKKKAEEAEQKRAEAVRKEEQRECWALLYKLIGRDPPALPPGDYKQPFHTSYSGIDIDREGMRLLLAALKARAGEAA